MEVYHLDVSNSQLRIEMINVLSGIILSTCQLRILLFTIALHPSRMHGAFTPNNKTVVKGDYHAIANLTLTLLD